jgi:hypothetical protein
MDPWYDLRVPWEWFFKIRRGEGVFAYESAVSVVGGNGGERANRRFRAGLVSRAHTRDRFMTRDECVRGEKSEKRSLIWKE